MRAIIATLLLAATASHAARAPDGFIATRDDPLIRAADGRVVWDLNRFAFAKGAPPAGVNPGLWRNLQAHARHGLFRVADGVWQVRGFDISNMTLIAGRTGWIVVDPLVTAEAARAALELANAKLGARPVTALVYTHSHTDHFGGARGVLDEAEVKAGRAVVVAPDGFPEHAASENVMAGTAMGRRATYQFGTALEAGPNGTLGSGIGPALSAGTITLIPPTDLVKATGDVRVLDGVRFEFQMTPETEAPAEFNLFIPDKRALLVAELATCTTHNIQTPRGAPVRDALAWSNYLTEALRRYGARTDVLLMSHCAPVTGREAARAHLAAHRDLYKFTHDQSVRLLNRGLTPGEIAETLKLPPALAARPELGEFYGTLKGNARGVYDRYLGWFDGNPANLDPLPPEALGAKMAAAFGGADAMRAAAARAVEAGDDRFAATLLNHLVMAGDVPARAALADVYGRLGRSATSAVWRNIYLMGAKELTAGVTPGRTAVPIDLLAAMPTPLLFDALATRLDPARAGDAPYSIRVTLTDRGAGTRLAYANGVLVSEPGVEEAADASVTTTTRGMLALFGTDIPLNLLTGTTVTGDAKAVERLRASLDRFAPDFAIVTP